MKNKGFTLTELLGVMIILGILGLIAIPTVTRHITKSKQDLYLVQINTIEKATENYITKKLSEETVEIGTEESIKSRCQNDNLFVTYADLKRNGFLENVENPLTGKEFDDNTVVKVSCDGEEYKYQTFTE